MYSTWIFRLLLMQKGHGRQILQLRNKVIPVPVWCCFSWVDLSINFDVNAVWKNWHYTKRAAFVARRIQRLSPEWDLELVVHTSDHFPANWLTLEKIAHPEAPCCKPHGWNLSGHFSLHRRRQNSNGFPYYKVYTTLISRFVIWYQEISQLNISSPAIVFWVHEIFSEK